VAVGEVTVIVPVATAHVGCVTLTVGIAGIAFTVTETWELTVEKPSLTATEYVVLTDGITVGLAELDVNPAGFEVQA
jgi:hypothetical protein